MFPWSLPLAWAEDAAVPPPIAADRVWEVLAAPTGDRRAAFRAAGEALGDWTVSVAGVEFDGPRLVALAEQAPGDPFVRVLREQLRRAVDPDDLLLFLDDVLVAGAAGRRGERFSVPAGRARGAGILLHVGDVWENEPRRYPDRPEIAVDEPPPQEVFPVAVDGEVLGPNWTMRYRAPSDPAQMYRTLAEKRPGSTFPSRVAGLVAQLEQQGAEVWLTSFLRYRERGYLLWGAFLLRRCADDPCVARTVAELDAANAEWAHVPVVWTHPEGAAATREAARRMADVFDVVFATREGARHSNHYDGTAADFVADGLPRTVELWAPDGAHRVFDLSGAEHARDLSLEPELVKWIEAHFGLHKLRSDHPHWDDAEARGPG